MPDQIQKLLSSVTGSGSPEAPGAAAPAPTPGPGSNISQLIAAMPRADDPPQIRAQKIAMIEKVATTLPDPIKSNIMQQLAKVKNDPNAVKGAGMGSIMSRADDMTNNN